MSHVRKLTPLKSRLEAAMTRFVTHAPLINHSSFSRALSATALRRINMQLGLISLFDSPCMGNNTDAFCRASRTCSTKYGVRDADISNGPLAARGI